MAALTAAALGSTAAGGCAGRPLHRLSFVGNTAFTDTELRDGIVAVAGPRGRVAAHDGGASSEEALRRDYAFLRKFYGDHGYLDADPKDPKTRRSHGGRSASSIPIAEGPQYHLGAMTAREVLQPGEPMLFDSDALDQSIDPVIRPGDVASMGKILKIREDIERRYEDEGHAFVDVSAEGRFDREKLLFSVDLEIDKGPVVFIELIEMIGNEKTADEVIRRELTVAEGDRYSATGRETSELRVMRLGHFSAVHTSTSRGSADDKIVLRIELIESLAAEQTRRRPRSRSPARSPSR